MLLCYDYQNGITDEEKNIIFATKPELFSIGTINLPKTIKFMKTIDVEIMDTYVKTIISKLEFEVQSTKKKIADNRYELEVALKDKLYPEMYYIHQPGNVVHETTTKNKAQAL
jgi:hypothetical protein